MPSRFLPLHLWLVAGLIPLFDRLLSFKQLLRLVTPPLWLAPYRAVPVETIAGIVNRRLARPLHMKRRKCLRHGLVLFHFLCLAGKNPTLVFGVFPWQEKQRGLAHCWVVLDGCELSPKPDEAVAEVLHYTRKTNSVEKQV